MMAYSPATAPLDGLIGLAQIQNALEALFAELLELPVAAVSFLRQPRQQHRGPRAQLDPIAWPHLGVDELRRTVTAGGAELTEESIGQRTLVLQVQVWADTQSLDTAPMSYIERLRTRLRWTTTQQALQRCCLSFDRAEQPVTFTQRQDCRQLSTASIDLRLSYAWVEADTAHTMSWIEQAFITADKLRDPAGTAFDDALQPTIHVDTSTP